MICTSSCFMCRLVACSGCWCCDGYGLRLGQPVEQGLDAGPRGAQAGLERVALLGQGLDLAGEQGIGALQLGVAHQQALHPFGDQVDVGLVRHTR
jgi:hypothetical protein